jgi:hypothetical protein
LLPLTCRCLKLSGHVCQRPAAAWGVPCPLRWHTLPHRPAGWCSALRPPTLGGCARLRCAWHACSGAGGSFYLPSW